MFDYCFDLNSSRTNLFFNRISNKFMFKMSLHFTLMSCNALTTSVFIKSEWKQNDLNVSSKSKSNRNNPQLWARDVKFPHAFVLCGNFVNDNVGA